MGNPERQLRFGHIWIMFHDDDIEMLQMTHSFVKIQQIYLPPTNGVGNVMLVSRVCLSQSVSLSVHRALPSLCTGSKA